MLSARYSTLRDSDMTDLRSNLLAYAYTQNFSLVGFQHFESVTFQIDLVARLWNFTRNVAKQSGNGGDRCIGLVAKLYPEQFLYIVDGHTAAHDQAAIGFTNHVGQWLLSIVTALTHDFFHHILHSGHARD